MPQSESGGELLSSLSVYMLLLAKLEVASFIDYDQFPPPWTYVPTCLSTQVHQCTGTVQRTKPIFSDDSHARVVTAKLIGTTPGPIDIYMCSLSHDRQCELRRIEVIS